MVLNLLKILFHTFWK